MLKTAVLLKPVSRLLAIGVLLGSMACTSIYRNHGYVPTAEELAALQVGVDTRDSVIEAIGTPSSSGMLDDSGYFYVTTRFRHYGARQPEIVSRQLVAIRFDQRGVVRNIERYGLEQGRIVELDRRVTDSSIEDKSFLRQLLGNVSTFNPGNLVN
ncbi:outer membrane protein assembly factor BamE [Lutimaribacter marinistellae]|uniref:Outer membrane protein assembly factor BamE n=1 Tax=Lutimaribacter marinistellae TaxID=1820329 RepID=A0ABV7THC9_9RHOB